MRVVTSGDPCTFCGHIQAVHVGNPNYKTGCVLPSCRCAVYSSPEDVQRNQKFKSDAVRPVTVTARDLADRIHALREHRFGATHSEGLSCPCAHLALYYLGLRVDPGIYWPDGKGGNAWAMAIDA